MLNVEYRTSNQILIAFDIRHSQFECEIEFDIRFSTFDLNVGFSLIFDIRFECWI